MSISQVLLLPPPFGEKIRKIVFQRLPQLPLEVFVEAIQRYVKLIYWLKVFESDIFVIKMILW